MSVEFFDGQRREMIAAIRVIAGHLAAEVGKAALDDRVLNAMAKVPRHEFVPVEVQPYAYLNRPLPIGFDKTISQPLMVAVMTDLLELEPDDLVLEIGTGRGYQAAVLAELAGRVYSVELIDELAQRAGQLLKRQGYTNIEVRVANGYFGWPEHAPFDKVMVTAAPDLIPAPLINQLKAGGRMVIPVGLPDAQQLVLTEKDINGRVTTKEIMPVRFSLLEEPDQRAFRPSCSNGCGILRMKTEADELSMPRAFRQFYLDCEGKQSIKHLCLSIKMAVSELTVWYLFAALVQ